MRIAVIGKGRVGSALGPAFARAGHDVVYGVRDPADAKHENGDGLSLATTPDAAQSADVIILSVDWSGALAALDQCGDLSGKILIDCNNPLKFGDDGLELAFGFTDSAAEQIAARTNATVVKTLNQVGSTVMERAHTYRRRPIQFVAGDDAPAKSVVSRLVSDIGFQPIDYGALVNARKLEPLAMVWIDQAFKHGMNSESAWFLETE